MDRNRKKGRGTEDRKYLLVDKKNTRKKVSKHERHSLPTKPPKDLRYCHYHKE